MENRTLQLMAVVGLMVNQFHSGAMVGTKSVEMITWNVLMGSGMEMHRNVSVCILFSPVQRDCLLLVLD